MSTVEQIRSLNRGEYTAIVIGFISTLAPGVLILCLFSRELFLEISSLKLILLAFAISLPWVLANFIVAFIANLRNPNGTITSMIGSSVFYGAINASLVLYLSIAVTFLLNKNALFLVALGVVSNVVLAAIYFYGYSGYLKRANAHNKSKQSDAQKTRASV
ncbi:hypothetical protein [Microbulbifer hydrolyticus]|uniref:Uncharacterized protein n=1 Tax=Microbulbifer hydrolyticus TaxID=48074 RepID=A0A6P1T9J3_9GAMM|nr:hypothetical protein [Microbulbifer hydrolyticus]MBB5213249.1 hypothetical protein [Microbulbifer hydrolyticus]QHQ38491.1 hypothetical protein GTQ55_05445 [Microbulbifer hydrolyticus]